MGFCRGDGSELLKDRQILMWQSHLKRAGLWETLKFGAKSRGNIGTPTACIHIFVICVNVPIPEKWSQAQRQTERKQQ